MAFKQTHTFHSLLCFSFMPHRSTNTNFLSLNVSKNHSTCSGLLYPSFLSSSSLSFQSSFSVLCQTKRNRPRKSLARSHDFRRRIRTTSGRAVLKRRHAKGWKVLCTKSNPNSGKHA